MVVAVGGEDCTKNPVVTCSDNGKVPTTRYGWTLYGVELASFLNGEPRPERIPQRRSAGESNVLDGQRNGDEHSNLRLEVSQPDTGQKDVSVTRPSCTPLNPHNLPLSERAPEISTQLIVLEHLFQAARERGSGAVPMQGDADWDEFWFGLERIVRHVRLLAQDMYAQGRLEILDPSPVTGPRSPLSA